MNLTAEQDIAGLLGPGQTVGAVKQAGNFPGQPFLTGLFVRGLATGRVQFLDFVLFQIGQKPQTPANVLIRRVDPVLVKLVGAGALPGNPYGALFRLAHFRSIGGCQQRVGDTEQLHAVHPSGQINPGGNVSPLVTASDLQLTFVVPVQTHKIVGLQQHVTELGVTDPRFTVQAAANRVFGHHHVDRKMLAHIPEKFQVADFLHPFQVVGHDRPVFPVTIQHLTDLGLDAGNILFQLSGGQQISLGTFSRGIANHSGGATDQGNDAVSGALESPQHQQRQQAAHMQTFGRGIKAGVDRSRLAGQPCRQVVRVGGLVNQAAP